MKQGWRNACRNRLAAGLASAYDWRMNRRQFLKTSGTAAFAIAAAPTFAADFADMKKRVGLIGTGWYGKIDLLRLIQVAPVEVVSLCDVDKKMLGDAADA